MLKVPAERVVTPEVTVVPRQVVVPAVKPIQKITPLVEPVLKVTQRLKQPPVIKVAPAEDITIVPKVKAVPKQLLKQVQRQRVLAKQRLAELSRVVPSPRLRPRVPLPRLPAEREPPPKKKPFAWKYKEYHHLVRPLLRRDGKRGEAILGTLSGRKKKKVNLF